MTANLPSTIVAPATFVTAAPASAAPAFEICSAPTASMDAVAFARSANNCLTVLVGGASNNSPLAPFRLLKEVYKGARRNGIALRPDRVARKYARKLNQFLGAARAQRGAAA